MERRLGSRSRSMLAGRFFLEDSEDLTLILAPWRMKYAVYQKRNRTLWAKLQRQRWHRRRQPSQSAKNIYGWLYYRRTEKRIVPQNETYTIPHAPTLHPNLRRLCGLGNAIKQCEKRMYILLPLQLSLFISWSLVSDLLMERSFDCRNMF